MPDPIPDKASGLRWPILFLALGLLLVYALQRDTPHIRDTRTDLRNRIVGARIIKDGGFPYYYKWKNGDGLRYYDPSSFNSYKATVITASPFFHRMLSPIADWPEARIQRFWFVFEYAVLTGMMLCFFFRAGTIGQKQAVLLVYALFLLSNAWIFHVATGQLYICIPLFASLFFYCLRPAGSLIWAVLAGAAAACLLLIRINALFFFLPFLLLVRGFPRRWLIAFFIPPVLLAGWILLSPFERTLWQQYSDQMGEQLKLHQELNPPTGHNDPDPYFMHWEGLTNDTTNLTVKTGKAWAFSENGNVFVIYRKIFHRPLPLIALTISSLAVITLFLLLFYRKQQHRRGPADPVQVAILGFCLYMISDLFSPFYRHQYYTMQWVFPLLLAAAVYKREAARWYLLLFIGLLLNCIHLPFVRMGNTIGEYLILASLLLLVFFPGPQPNTSQPFLNGPKIY